MDYAHNYCLPYGSIQNQSTKGIVLYFDSYSIVFIIKI